MLENYLFSLPSDVIEHHILPQLDRESLIVCMGTSAKLKRLTSKLIVNFPHSFGYQKRILAALFKRGSATLLEWFRTILKYPILKYNYDMICTAIQCKHFLLFQFALTQK